MAKSSSERRSQPRIRLPLWALSLLILILASLLIGSAVWLFNTVEALASDWEVTDPDFGVVSEPAPVAVADNNRGDNPVVAPGQPVEPVATLDTDELTPWDQRDRVTILLLGIDQRCDDDGPTRTDTMMVLTMDPVYLTGAVVSLPRDLWVEIPGFGVDRINQAHYYGEIYEYPGGGPGLAVDTVEATLGVNVNYYATVNFEAFTDIVDQIGGIEVNVAEDIRDEQYPDNCYGYDPFYIDAGVQQLDGATALKYARTRATFGGDVDRANRQQEVIMAVRDKVLQLNMAPQLLARSPELWRSFQNNVRTNLSLNEAIQLGLLAQNIPQENIRMEVINYDYVYNETTPDGQQVLVPIRENIRQLRNDIFAPPAVPTPSITDLPAAIEEEEARVAVYNGTNVFGLAAATQEYLLAQDVNVVTIGNADASTYQTSQIIDYGIHPNTTLYLTQLMDIPPLNISSGTKPEGDFDILIIIGHDWSIPEP